MKLIVIFFYTLFLSSIKDLAHVWKNTILFISNLLPDLIVFSYIRPILLKMCGVKISLFSLCSIKKNVHIENPQNLSIGKNVNINRGVIITAHGNVVIEDNVAIAFNATILTIAHKGSKHEIDIIEPVHIKKGSHIGANSIILPGSILNEYTILSPGSVFSGESFENFVYVGNPARKVKERDDL